MRGAGPALSIFAVAFALLVDEILLTSIFHVLIGEGSTIAAISIALLGLSAGGIVVYLSPALHRPEGAEERWRRLLFLFGVALMASVFAIMSVPMNYMDLVFETGLRVQLLQMALYAAAAVPFLLGGIVISVILRARAAEVSRLYFADLFGGALGCLVSPVLLAGVGAPRGILLTALPAAALGALGLRGRLRAWVALPVALLALGLSDLGLLTIRKLNTMGEVRDPAYRPVSVEPGDLAFERWALDAWTAIRAPHVPQQWEAFRGWGVSDRYRGPVPDIVLVNFNARFSTYVTAFDGDFEALAPWLDSDLVSLHYRLGRRFDDVLNLGAGGGREVLSALHHGAESVVAVDISEVVVEDLMKDRLLAFSGGIYLDERVTAVADEGRSFAERSRERFDLIDFSIVGGANLEKMDLVRIDDLFTREAIETYVGLLTDEGVFSYTMYSLRADRVDALARRDFLIRPPYVPALRTLAGLRLAFEKRWPGREFRDHVLVAAIHGAIDPRFDLVHIIASVTPFTSSERARFDELCRELDFASLVPPDPGEDGLYARLAGSEDLAAFAGSLPFSVWPASDDRPFHFAFDWEHLARAHEHGQLFAFVAANPVLSLGVPIGLLALLVGASPLLGFALRGDAAAPLDRGGSGALLLYFACIGFGYMAVEIPILLRLQLHLGKPVYGLAVGLFSFLLASGLGSRLTQRARPDGIRTWIFAGTAAVLALGTLFRLGSPAIFQATLGLPLAARIAVDAAMIFPVAFAMGTFFPLGVKLLDRANPAAIPWAWAMNGCLSVVGIYGARAIALFAGFDGTLAVGLVSYLATAGFAAIHFGRR